MLLRLNLDAYGVSGQVPQEGAKRREISEVTDSHFLAVVVLARSPSTRDSANNCSILREKRKVGEP